MKDMPLSVLIVVSLVVFTINASGIAYASDGRSICLTSNEQTIKDAFKPETVAALKRSFYSPKYGIQIDCWDGKNPNSISVTYRQKSANGPDTSKLSQLSRLVAALYSQSELQFGNDAAECARESDVKTDGTRYGVSVFPKYEIICHFSSSFVNVFVNPIIGSN